MIVRSLPVGEWDKLSGFDLGLAVPYLDPKDTTLLVVEDGDRIVGCLAVLTWYHAEAAWIHPDYRKKPSVARKLWTGLHRIARGLGARHLVSGVCDPSVADLLIKRGASPLPMQSWVFPVKGL